MKIGTEDKKKMTILGVVGTLGIAGAFYIYSQLAVPDAPAPAAVSAPVAAPQTAKVAVVRTTAGAAVAKVAPAVQLDPTLKMGPMLMTESLVYTGSGRNIFSASSVPTEHSETDCAGKAEGSRGSCVCGSRGTTTASAD